MANAEKEEKGEENNPQEKLHSYFYLLSSFLTNFPLPGHSSIIINTTTQVRLELLYKQCSVFDKPHVPHSNLCTSLGLCLTLNCLRKDVFKKKKQLYPFEGSARRQIQARI